MIELLVVIAILATLVGILAPSVNAARTAAKVVHTKALIFTLESALSAFKADEVIGGAHPPSFYYVPENRSPYVPPPPMNNDDFDAWGAQMLVWSVVGADLQGTAGFAGGGNLNLRELYRITDGQPNYPRRQFVDPGKLTIKYPGECEIAGLLNLGTGGTRPVHPSVPMFLDYFNMPVLYYSRTPSPEFSEMLANFDRDHNEAFTHPDVAGDEDTMSTDDRFAAFLEDPRTAAFQTTGSAPRSHNYDTFILLSAGPDLKYGTADDVANFPVTP